MRAIPIHGTVAARPAPPRPRTPPARWRFRVLYAAPHRLAFAAGISMAALAAVWWAAALAARHAGWAWPWSLPPSSVHALVMSFGFMPMFFAGFLFTAGPKWLGLAPVPAHAIAGALASQWAGWGVLLLASVAPNAELARLLGGLGVAAAAAGWGRLVWRFLSLVAVSPVADRLHASVIAVAGAVGAMLWVAAAGALAVGDFALVRLLALTGLWVFIGVVYVTVAHRMIPFFSASALPSLDAWRPTWLLWVFAGTLGLEGALLWAEALPPAALAVRAALEAAVALLWLGLAVRWGLLQSLRIRLLAMLHLGFFWLGIAMALHAASHALQALGHGGLALAPLHAYTMGFLGSTLVAMATRVSAGHSGRALAVDGFAWALFWALQAAVIGRIMSELAGVAGMEGRSPLLAAAALWVAALLPWALRHLGWYGRPRVDGRPG
jgi:uncharacterized protein involved in response to NO